jgi:tRNA(Ile)-lysidine synthetase-like protein
VLTVDHGLRPGSAADAAFVADHAKALGLPAVVRTLTAADLEPHRGAGPEAAARAARYAALWPAADELGCAWLATGHTLDDQAETVLLQLLRGAGPDGLAGMAVRSGRLLRPLLGVRRAETRACCAAAGLAWREDPTNAGDAPLRNRVRHRLLPLLEELRPGAIQTLARTATLAADEQAWLAPLVATALSAVQEGGLDSQEGGVDSGQPLSAPSATLPAGAPPSGGGVPARPGGGGAAQPGVRGVAQPGVRGVAQPEPGGVAQPEPTGFRLDVDTLAGLPVALARRVVREAARRAGAAVPDAAATERVLGLAGGLDGAGTAWPGGVARREGTAVRIASPPD